MVIEASSALVACSAAIMLILGLAHLLFTYKGPRLLPRDRELQARMQQVSPVITRQTTMWRAWIGFNASHSLGLVLFGAVYGYLALFEGPLLFRSAFLLGLGLAVLASYLVLAQRYFFRVPLRALALSTLLLAAAIVLAAFA